MLAALAALACAGDVPNEFTNTKVIRKVDASKHAVTSTTSFKISGSGASKYYLAFTEEEAKNIVSISAEPEEDSVEKFAVVKDSSIDKPGFVHYVVKLRKAIEGSYGVKVTTTYRNVLVPRPAEIKQSEEQMVFYTLNAYPISPYSTEKASTQVKLASSDVESYSSSPSPSSVDGSKWKLGQYTDVQPYSVAPVSVHYTHNSFPFATIISLHREIEVSQWGNVAVEEHYHLEHTGAKLKGGFSRIDYSNPMRPQKSNSFEGLSAALPVGTSDVYYRDIIGNISTSAFRPPSAEFDMDFRFPLFGGWQTQWYQGYNVPASNHLTVDPKTGFYTLSFDAHCPFSDIPVQDHSLKVILPEGSTFVSVDFPIPHTLSHSRRFTYLDSPFFGRPVVVLKADGAFVSRSTYQGDVKVTYSMPPFGLLYKPIYLFVAFFGLFAVASMVSRIPFGLTQKGGKVAAAGVDKKNQ